MALPFFSHSFNRSAPSFLSSVLANSGGKCQRTDGSPALIPPASARPAQTTNGASAASPHQCCNSQSHVGALPHLTADVDWDHAFFPKRPPTDQRSPLPRQRGRLARL